MKTKFKIPLFIIFSFLFFLVSFSSFSSYELDRKYALETIGALKAWDNVDGVFAEYVENAFNEYFKKQSRFRYTDTTVLSKVLEGSKIPYHELIENKKILERVVRSGRIESLLRTKIFKEGSQYRIQIEWLLSTSLELLGNIEFIYTPKLTEIDPHGENLKILIYEKLSALIAQVPYFGHTTGVEGESVTINLGYNPYFRVGDLIEISTIQSVRTHPLLNKLVDWRFKKIGQIEILEIQEKISFGKIIETSGDLSFDKYQKITTIQPYEPKNLVLSKTNTSKNTEQKIEFSGIHTKDTHLNTNEIQTSSQPIRLGYISGGFSLGSMNREITGTTFSKQGSGTYFSPHIQGELWITRDFFGSVSIAPHFFGYSQTNQLNGVEETGVSGSGSGFHFDFSGGYNIHFSDNFFGPKAFFKLGYRSFSYNLPDSALFATSSTSYKSFYIGIGGNIPIQDLYGAYAELNFGLLRGMSDTFFLNSSPGSTSDIQVLAGGYYWIKPRIAIRGGINLNFNGADFSGGSSVQHNVTSFTLKGLYYF